MTAMHDGINSVITRTVETNSYQYGPSHEHGRVRQSCRFGLVRGRGRRTRLIRTDGRQARAVSRGASWRAPDYPHHAAAEPDGVRPRLLRTLPGHTRRSGCGGCSRGRSTVRTARQAARLDARSLRAALCGADPAGICATPSKAGAGSLFQRPFSRSGRRRLRSLHPDRRSGGQGRRDRASHCAPAYGWSVPHPRIWRRTGILGG